MAVYLILAVPAFTIIWTALVAAKNGDRTRAEDDFESNLSSRIELIDTTH